MWPMFMWFSQFRIQVVKQTVTQQDPDPNSDLQSQQRVPFTVQFTTHAVHTLHSTHSTYLS